MGLVPGDRVSHQSLCSTEIQVPYDPPRVMFSLKGLEDSELSQFKMSVYASEFILYYEDYETIRVRLTGFVLVGNVSLLIYLFCFLIFVISYLFGVGHEHSSHSSSFEDLSEHGTGRGRNSFEVC